MKIIEPSFEILDSIDGDEILRKLELAGRTCYKSECKIEPGSAPGFVGRIMKRHHESVIEHVSVTVRLIVDRGVSHELVRHRLASYSQESTRYCDYSEGGRVGELTFIRPLFWNTEEPNYKRWYAAMDLIQHLYGQMIDDGAYPQEARSVLPNSLKTEVVMTANLRVWRHVFTERAINKGAHPQMRQIMLPLLREFQRRIPVIFDDLKED